MTTMVTRALADGTTDEVPAHYRLGDYAVHHGTKAYARLWLVTHLPSGRAISKSPGEIAVFKHYGDACACCGILWIRNIDWSDGLAAVTAGPIITRLLESEAGS